MAFLYGILALYRINYGLAFDNMDIVHTYMHDLYFESAAMIVTLITLGKYLEVRSKSKTTDSIRKLMDLQPKIAHVIKDGQEADVPCIGFNKLIFTDFNLVFCQFFKRHQKV